MNIDFELVPKEKRNVSLSALAKKKKVALTAKKPVKK